MEIYNKYPKLEKLFETLFQTRYTEILSYLMEADNEYNKLRIDRADASMALKEVLSGVDMEILFEKYSDAIYAQEIFELEALYKQAVYDTLDVLTNNGLL